MKKVKKYVFRKDVWQMRDQGPLCRELTALSNKKDALSTQLMNIWDAQRPKLNRQLLLDFKAQGQGVVSRMLVSWFIVCQQNCWGGRLILPLKLLVVPDSAFSWHATDIAQVVSEMWVEFSYIYLLNIVHPSVFALFILKQIKYQSTSNLRGIWPDVLPPSLLLISNDEM